MSEIRTALQCQARGCDGCVVCDRETYSEQDLAEFRELERGLLDITNSDGWRTYV